MPKKPTDTALHARFYAQISSPDQLGNCETITATIFAAAQACVDVSSAGREQEIALQHLLEAGGWFRAAALTATPPTEGGQHEAAPPA